MTFFTKAALTAAVAGALAAGPLVGAHADSLFDFNTVAAGTYTPLSLTNNGITANFFATTDPNGFLVYAPPAGSLAAPFDGNALYEYASAPSFLEVQFSQNVQSLSLGFLTADTGSPTPLTVAAYSGYPSDAVKVATASVAGTVPAGYTYPQGVLTLNSATPFNYVYITDSSRSNLGFAVNDIDVVAAANPAVPEASSFALLGLGLLPLGLIAKKRAARRA